jgi:sigma-B regulation protein RsbQ
LDYPASEDAGMICFAAFKGRLRSYGRLAWWAERHVVGVVERNNVHFRGSGERAMMFAHGFGCDQNMWRFVEPAFERDFRTVLFDHVGAGGSDLKAYSNSKYSTLGGYADDVVEIGREIGLKDAVFVAHSVSCMIGVLAVQRAPGMFGRLVMIGPSARYIDDADYVGDLAKPRSRSSCSFLNQTTWVGRPKWHR